MTRLLSVSALALLTGVLSFGQYMNDGSSTYADTWGDQTYGVLGYGSISHGLSIPTKIYRAKAAPESTS